MRTVKPMDAALVIESVKKTGRLMAVDTGWRECGIGAEVVANSRGRLKASGPPLSA